MKVTSLKNYLYFPLSLSLFVHFSCHRLPDSVWIDKPGLYPEGIEYSFQKKLFLVTSLKEGSVGTVDSKGTYTRFIDDPQLISAIGIRLDEKRNRLYVANSDPGVSVKSSIRTHKRIAGLGIYSLSDGKLIRYHDLAKLLPGFSHFANDIALDSKTGDIYVTDSFAPAIYKVPLEGEPSVFLESPDFTGTGFNLNGIVIVRDYLLVAKYNEGRLFRVALSNPDNYHEVKLSQELPGADGLIASGEDSIVLIANGNLNSVFTVQSGDNFNSATVTKSDRLNWRYNTTGVRVEKNYYVLNAELDQLFGAKHDVQKFEIRKYVPVQNQ